MADPPVQSFAEALRARPDSRSQATADAAVACPQAAAAARLSTVACDGADVRKADSIATFKLTIFLRVRPCVDPVCRPKFFPTPGFV
jgi:hypothetical protein